MHHPLSSTSSLPIVSWIPAAQFVEALIDNPKLDGQFGHVDVEMLYPTEEERNAKIHVDALGVLVFARLPLMAKWVVASGFLASPSFLECAHADTANDLALLAHTAQL